MAAAFFLASLIVAFVAGIVALAMPCCFTVLLPSYVAKSFTSVRGRLGMTAVFGAGMATVLLPIAMGATLLTSFITLNHALLFVIGGFFMIVLGLLTLWGMSFLPQVRAPVDLGRRDLPSVYGLGVFGGVASSCCAPVLAGVVVLTVFAGGWFAALSVGVAYVVGMVFPLLIAAIAWDRRVRSPSRRFQGRMVSLRRIGLRGEIHSSKLVAGTLFVAMGVFTIVLGVLDRMLLNPLSDTFGIYQAVLERGLTGILSDPVGLALFIAGLLALVTLGVLWARRVRQRPSGEETEDGAPEEFTAEELGAETEVAPPPCHAPLQRSDP